MSSSRPLVIGVSELQRRPGSRREVTRALELEGLAISTAAVPEGGEIQVAVAVESLGDDVAVEGRVTAPFVGDCRRCLAEVRGEVFADVREIFQKHPVEGETYPIAGDHIDLEPPMRDAIVLELPFVPLCREDCLGLCPQCGFALNDDPSHRHEPPVDPRWAPLRGLTDQTDRR